MQNQNINNDVIIRTLSHFLTRYLFTQNLTDTELALISLSESQRAEFLYTRDIQKRFLPTFEQIAKSDEVKQAIREVNLTFPILQEKFLDPKITLKEKVHMGAVLLCADMAFVFEVPGPVKEKPLNIFQSKRLGHSRKNGKWLTERLAGLGGHLIFSERASRVGGLFLSRQIDVLYHENSDPYHENQIDEMIKTLCLSGKSEAGFAEYIHRLPVNRHHGDIDGLISVLRNFYKVKA